MIDIWPIVGATSFVVLFICVFIEFVLKRNSNEISAINPLIVYAEDKSKDININANMNVHSGEEAVVVFEDDSYTTSMIRYFIVHYKMSAYNSKNVLKLLDLIDEQHEMIKNYKKFLQIILDDPKVTPANKDETKYRFLIERQAEIESAINGDFDKPILRRILV